LVFFVCVVNTKGAITVENVVGFIGLGLMGKPMALNLIKGGHSLVVHSRSRGPVDELVGAGARSASSPAEVARQSSIVITMLPDTPDVELVLDGPDGAMVFDVRTDSGRMADPRRIPGAMVLRSDDTSALDAKLVDLPRDREIILYCT